MPRLARVHSIDGDLRTRVENFVARLGVGIESLLAEIGGVSEVRLSRSVRAVGITSDPATLASEHRFRTMLTLLLEAAPPSSDR